MRTTAEPAGNEDVHEDPHAIPDGVDVTNPYPEPSSETASVLDEAA